MSEVISTTETILREIQEEQSAQRKLLLQSLENQRSLLHMLQARDTIVHNLQEELATTIKIELGGGLANLETKLMNRLEALEKRICG